MQLAGHSVTCDVEPEVHSERGLELFHRLVDGFEVEHGHGAVGIPVDLAAEHNSPIARRTAEEGEGKSRS